MGWGQPWGLSDGQGDCEQLASEAPTWPEFRRGSHWHMDRLSVRGRGRQDEK